jgi:NifU-like protein involved in Fe-S cluster formation
MSDTTALLTQLGYSEKAIGYILERTNYGDMEKPSVRVKYQGDCGDMIELFLAIEDDRITDASFLVVGCAGLQASGSTVTEMVKNLTLDQANEITVQDILVYSGGIPENKLDCVETSHNALQKAIKTYREE